MRGKLSGNIEIKAGGMRSLWVLLACASTVGVCKAQAPGAEEGSGTGEQHSASGSLFASQIGGVFCLPRILSTRKCI